MKIIKLLSENIKRLRAIEIKPDGSLVIIGGKNAQGKTSVLDSIEYALAGTSSIPDKPIRKGEKKARVVVDLGNIIVTRTFTEGGSKLVVSDKEGFPKSSPQSLLDSLTGKLSFDPLGFLKMKAEEQLKIVKELAGIDFTGLDEKKKKAYDERTVVNGIIKTLKGQVEGYQEYKDVPKEEISQIGLLNELETWTDKNRENEKHRETLKHLMEKVEESDKILNNLREEIKRLREKWDGAVKENETFKKLLNEKSIEVDSLQDFDTTLLRTQISSAEEINVLIRSNLKRNELLFDLESRQKESEKLTEMLEGIEEEKVKLIASSKLPIPELTFDSSTLYYKGVPFIDQSSSAEQLRVSVAMGFAMNPKLKILLIRDGSLLDEDNKKMIAKMAEEADGQLWLEVVTEDKGEAQVIIEDGMVRE